LRERRGGRKQNREKRKERGERGKLRKRKSGEVVDGKRLGVKIGQMEVMRKNKCERQSGEIRMPLGRRFNLENNLPQDRVPGESKVIGSIIKRSEAGSRQKERGEDEEEHVQLGETNAVVTI